jgi:hypothetical protein
MRRMLAVTLGVLVWVALDGQPAWAEPCPIEPHQATLTAPERLAYERQGAVWANTAPYDPRLPWYYFASGRLEYLDASGRVFFNHALTAEELSRGGSSFPAPRYARHGFRVHSLCRS